MMIFSTKPCSGQMSNRSPHLSDRIPSENGICSPRSLQNVSGVTGWVGVFYPPYHLSLVTYHLYQSNIKGEQMYLPPPSDMEDPTQGDPSKTKGGGGQAFSKPLSSSLNYTTTLQSVGSSSSMFTSLTNFTLTSSFPCGQSPSPPSFPNPLAHRCHRPQSASDIVTVTCSYLAYLTFSKPVGTTRVPGVRFNLISSFHQCSGVKFLHDR